MHVIVAPDADDAAKAVFAKKKNLRLLLTGPLAWLVERYTEVPANIALIPVAVAIGVARTKLVPFIHKLLSALAAGARLALEDADSTRGRE